MIEGGRRPSYLQASLHESCYVASRATVPLVMAVSGTVDVDRLGGAVLRVLARHEALYSVFDDRDGELLCVVRHPETVPIRRIHAVDGERAMSAVAAEVSKAITVSPTDPLTRVSLVVGDAEVTYVVFVIHHLVGDGASLAILAEEVVQAYRGDLQPVTAHRAEPDLHWERRRERRRRYWRERLDCAEVTLPVSRPVAARWGPRVAPTILPRASVDRAAAWLRTAPGGVVAGATVAALASHFELVGDLTIGVMTAARSEETAGTVGFLADLLPCRIATGATVGEVVGSAARAVMDDVSAALPLGEIVRSLPAARGGRVFDVVVNYRDVAMADVWPLEADGARFSTIDVAHEWGDEGLDPWWAGFGLVHVEVDAGRTELSIGVSVAEGVATDGGAVATGMATVLEQLCSEDRLSAEVGQS